MNIKNFFQSNSVSKMILALSILLVVLVVFQAGFFVGYHKGVFTNDWGNNYMMRGPDNSPRAFFAPFMNDGDDINPHGAVGEIISVNLPTIVIKGPGRAEEIAIVDSNTTIRNFQQLASTSDLIVGRSVVIIGEPNGKGQINASLIRIMPVPKMMSSSSTTVQQSQ
jgi:hypothetical protein